MTREGLLEAQWIENEAPHPRKYYRLTPRGARRLREMTIQWKALAAKIDRLMAAAEEGTR
jgi:DNA-binding PadR family transcriptional regulator